MKLQYRGNYYESHPQAIETHDTGIAANYRGLTYKVCRPLVRTCSQPPVNLKYRGIAYTIGQTPAIKSRSLASTSLIYT